MSYYSQRISQFETELSSLNRRYTLIGTFRFLAVLLGGVFIYLSQIQNNSLLLLLLLIPVGLFRYLMVVHEQLSDRIDYTKALIQINQQEETFLAGGSVSFDTGAEFMNVTHPYAHDLDIFGEKSLYQHLNRTTTVMGKDSLAQHLLNRLPSAVIPDRQQSIRELAGMSDFRQRLQAQGTVHRDSIADYESLLAWAQQPVSTVPVWARILAFVVPAILGLFFIGFFITGDGDYLTVCGFIAAINLFLLSRQMDRIKAETAGSEFIGTSIRKYSYLIAIIENQPFQSPELQQLKSVFKVQDTSRQVRKLSVLLAGMNGIQHTLAMLFSNGLFQSHVHTLHQLSVWKKQYAAFIPSWIDTIGTFETISSFGNFSFNNPSYAFPELSDMGEMTFQEIGHPLLKSRSRVTNDITFNPRFIILTGSNMSGKSTFLRTVGVNLVLTNAGSCVCASAARVQPLDILVSMRLNDSLADSESYFFAEVKRLQLIVQTLQKKPCFILLDEIFRGTNSDDKRSGTIEVIKKIITTEARGLIATHDLEVCSITELYPTQLINKRFEVEIINDELVFPYKLLDGVCQNKSATFLMKKMGVI